MRRWQREQPLARGSWQGDSAWRAGASRGAAPASCRSSHLASQSSSRDLANFELAFSSGVNCACLANSSRCAERTTLWLLQAPATRCKPTFTDVLLGASARVFKKSPSGHDATAGTCNSIVLAGRSSTRRRARAARARFRTAQRHERSTSRSRNGTNCARNPRSRVSLPCCPPRPRRTTPATITKEARKARASALVGGQPYEHVRSRLRRAPRRAAARRPPPRARRRRRHRLLPGKPDGGAAGGATRRAHARQPGRAHDAALSGGPPS